MKNVFFYGTLMGTSIPGLNFLSLTSIPGLDLYDVGAFPAAVHGKGEVVGELYEVEDEAAFDVTDGIEGYDSEDHNAKRNLYKRISMLTQGGERTEVYVFNQAYKHLPKIETGNWRDRV